jgi:L-alanine-DL-glutamate epimerase-like enolase superfamily enzyme
MTIKSVETRAVSLPFEVWGPKSAFAGRPRSMDILFVRVETQDGLVGWGEAFGYAIWPATRVALERLIAPMAVGADEADIECITLDMQKKLHLVGRTGPAVFALSGLDIALWDIAGKRAGKPLFELLGGARKRSLPAYASLVRYGSNDLVAQNSSRAKNMGYRAVKLHEITVDAVRTARETLGPDIRLMMDTNCPWSVEEALAIAAGVKPFNLHWFEEPIWPPEDFAGLAEVRRRGGVPVSAGENAISLTHFEQMFDAGAVDVAQPSVTKIGGVSEMMKIARLARERGVRLVPHSPYFGPGLLATLHMAATFEHDTMIEVSLVDLGASPMGEAVLVKNGEIVVPEGPGLGCDPDPEVLREYAV